MIAKVKIALRQFKFMYQDDRISKMCNDIIGSDSQDEKFYRMELLKITRKISNPEVSRIVNLILGNMWDDVFYKGFLNTLDPGDQDIVKS